MHPALIRSIGCILFPFLCLLTIVAGCQTMTVDDFKANWHAYIGGTYPGQIMSGGLEISSRTIFEYTQEGELTGRYELYELDGTKHGTLYDFQIMDFLSLRCRWKDDYGVGVLYITFSPDLASFDGYWAKAGGKRTFSWNGSRVESWEE